MPAPTPTPRGPRIALALVLMCGAIAYLPSLRNGFIRWDDDINFLQNPHFRGLGFQQVSWAFTATHIGVYQPLAWILFEIEYLFFGLAPWGYHLVSLLLHLANALVLFRLAENLLGRTTLSRPSRLAVWVTGLFLLHPLRVEPVVWASAQPYLGAALFSLVTVEAYLRWVDHPGEDRYPIAATAAFGAALLFKAAVMGLPLVLLALDRYPLNRWKKGQAGARFREKIPFFALSLIFGAVAIVARESGGIGNSEWLAETSLSEIAARVGYFAGFFLEKTILPFDLAGFYPLPAQASLGEGAFALRCALVALLTVVLFRQRRRSPAPFVAWMIYLALSFPFLGFLRVGTYLVADRYSYLSTLGFYFLLVAAVARGSRPVRWAGALTGIAGLGFFGLLTALQVGTWRDSKTFWQHALSLPATQAAEKNGNPFVATAHFSLALAHCDQSPRSSEGLLEALRTVALWPPWNLDVGKLLLDCRWLEEGERRLQAETERAPENPEAWNYWGMALTQQKHYTAAEKAFRQGLERAPQSVALLSNLGVLLGITERFSEAEAVLSQARQLAPTDETLQKEWQALQRRRGVASR